MGFKTLTVQKKNIQKMPLQLTYLFQQQRPTVRVDIDLRENAERSEHVDKLLEALGLNRSNRLH